MPSTARAAEHARTPDGALRRPLSRAGADRARTGQYESGGANRDRVFNRIRAEVVARARAEPFECTEPRTVEQIARKRTLPAAKVTNARKSLTEGAWA